jgi:hypothetical protein
MLSIYFGDGLDGVITAPNIFFDNQFDAEWMNDELTKKMIKDVDKSDVLAPYCIQSPVLGQISPFMISGGVKALILMNNRPDIVVNASYCGDNCAKWINEIGKVKDVTIRLGYPMLFKDIVARCLNDDSKIENKYDYVDKVMKFL